MSGPWRQVAGGLELAVIVTPRASASRVLGIADGRLRVAVTAPANENQANKALLRFLSGWLDQPAGALSIRAGATSRRKTVLVEGAGPELMERSVQID